MQITLLFQRSGRRFRKPLLALLALLWTAVAAGAEPTVGEPAPDFTLQGVDGTAYPLSAHRGQGVVLAWFPKAFTPG